MTSNSNLSLARRQWQGALLVALSGMLYGVIAYFGTQLIHHHFTVPTMLFWRFFIATLWMAMSMLITKKKFYLELSQQPALIKTAVLAAIYYSTASALYFLSSLYIGTGLAMVIFFSFPVFVTLFAYLLSDWQMNKYAFCSLIAVIVGLFLLKGKGATLLNPLGILFALLAALCYAVYMHGSQHNAKKMDSRLLTLATCLGNSLIFFIIAILTHQFLIPNSFNEWVWAITLGVFATALPIQLLLDGLKYISPVKASILSVLEPTVTVIMGLILLNETISSLQTVGVVIVLLGALFIQFEKNIDHA